MPIRDLLKNRDIVARGLTGDELIVTQDFVGRRVRALIDANPGFGDPKSPGDITTAATPGVATTLKAEIPKVKKAHSTIATRVAADVTKKLHVAIDKPTLRKHVADRPPAGDTASMRLRLILSIVFQAAATDMTLADPANIERLHRLCDRRLRIVERMLYDVGHAPPRSWNKTQIRSNPGGPWIDGLERAFEYPRVPRTFFEENCRPNANDECQAPMSFWKLGDDNTVVGPIQTNPGATARWRPGTKDAYSLEYTRASGAAPKGVEAITDLFKPSIDFLQRNLMYCDHTIHTLHLEALVFAETKRHSAGDTAWLDDLIKAKPDGWLRLFHPLVSPGSADPGNYLVGGGEPSFFEHLTVRPQDLQVGDHLIIYNHPAYEYTTFHGAWRLENAVVVQTAPDLRMQGHGSGILSMDSAKSAMLKYFRDALVVCRKFLRPLAAVTANGTKPNTVNVNTTGTLRRGMMIDIVDAATQTPLAQGRKITSLDARKKIVGYSGPGVTASAKHEVRRAHVVQFKKFDSLQLENPTSSTTIFLLRRVDPAVSTFAPNCLDADWHVAWVATDREDAIRKDAKRAAFVKAQHKVEYTVETDGTNTRTVGWFPLYEPALKRGRPVMTGGKISSIQPVSIGADNIAAWTWFGDPDVAAAVVPVIRPKVS